MMPRRQSEAVYGIDRSVFTFPLDRKRVAPDRTVAEVAKFRRRLGRSIREAANLDRIMDDATEAVRNELKRQKLTHLERTDTEDALIEDVVSACSEDGLAPKEAAYIHVGRALRERPGLDPEHVTISNPGAHEGGARL